MSFDLGREQEPVAGRLLAEDVGPLHRHDVEDRRADDLDDLPPAQRADVRTAQHGDELGRERAVEPPIDARDSS